jgi:aldehyde dehydrogenase (NAD+)
MSDNTTQEIESLFNKQKAYKRIAKNTDAKYRLQKLKAVKKKILEHRQEILDALSIDFRKPHVESDMTELMPVISMINLMEKELPVWMKDQKVKSPLVLKGTKNLVRYEGKGNCLVISPWNYPFHLSLYPVLTSFAAGNTTILKPSEFTVKTNEVCKKIISECFDENEVAVIEGEVETTTQLLDKPWDHIFFTGSTPVGKIIMQAASKHLASVSLELGGKSPAIIDKDVDIKSAIDKLTWGKMVNGGQTCVAPDYILCYREQEENIINGIIGKIKEFYPQENWSDCKDFSKL